MAQKALRSAFGGTLIDASCGSGLFTRRFAQSGDYGEVVALDYSEAMLQQALTFCKEESLPMAALTFVRADIGRIPFPEGTIDGVHAGAAIHCWPSPKVRIFAVVLANCLRYICSQIAVNNPKYLVSGGLGHKMVLKLFE
jgi:ubiquinone/menaquinone biosynthesis C-methylase UbiE